MENKSDLINKLKEIIKNKKIGMDKLIILLLVGVFLIVISIPASEKKTNNPNSSGEEAEAIDKNAVDSNQEYIDYLENKLEERLRKVNQIGDVIVIITLKSSKETVINKDSPYEKTIITEYDNAGGERESSTIKNEQETVVINSDGNEQPIVIKELEPEIEGIVVIAQGGDNQKVISDITDMSYVLFGVPAHKVKVMKMV